MRLSSIAAAGAALVMVTIEAGAATVYTDRTTFLGTAGSTSNVDFEGLAAPAGTAFYPSGLTAGGVTITANQLFAISSTAILGGVAGGGSLGSGDYMEGSYASTCCGTFSTSFSMGAGITAFGLDLRSYNQNPSNLPADYTGSFQYDFVLQNLTHITGSVASNLPLPPAFAQPVPAFLGLTSSIPILSLTITPNGDNTNQPSAQFFHFDNMVISDSSVPEPTTMLMSGIGLFALGLIQRRK